MKKLKKVYANYVYFNIILVASCALLWADIRWQQVISIAVLSIFIIALAFDRRYGNLFK